MDPNSPTSYLIFDVEAVADGALVSKIRYPGEGLEAVDAIQRYRQELVAERGEGKDFIPYTFMLPAALAVGRVDADYRLLDLTVLDAPEYRPHVIAKRFWQGWQHYHRPTLVTFNGRGYDVPLMELAAYRYGINLASWFALEARTYDQPRNRYNVTAHLDLYDVFSNYGATRMVGGLNLLANLIGKPGKTGVDGSQVQDMYFAGRTQEINDYCRCDVLDTYFVFLRSRVLVGQLKLEQEQELVAETRHWLEERADACPAYREYLSHWGTWTLPTE